MIKTKTCCFSLILLKVKLLYMSLELFSGQNKLLKDVTLE